MPNRIIKESIKYSLQIDSLTWFEEVVFYRLLVTADDYGCLNGRVILLKNELFPTKDNITKKSIEIAIEKLIAVGLLCGYMVNGVPYLFFPTWEKHQRIRNKYRKYPEPPQKPCAEIDGQLPANGPYESESNFNSMRIQIQDLDPNGMVGPSNTVAPVEQIKDLYNQICTSYSRCITLSQARKKAIEARWTSGYRLKNFEELFHKAENSSFLRGNNDRKWMASFDWLLKEANMVKVLDGLYDDVDKRKSLNRMNDLDDLF